MFSGIGGFELGISNALEQRRCGQKENIMEADVSVPISKPNERQSAACIGYSEINKYAVQVYEKQFKGHKNYGDATRIVPEELPDFDLLVGGFPCQAFSIAGKRLGFNDTRGTLFFDIARILSVKRPKHFILENVKGLLSHDDGRTFKTILSTLVELGYGVEWQVLNSKNHGVPQNRERVFIVGHLGGEGCGKVFSVGESNTIVNEQNTQRNDVAHTITNGEKLRGSYVGGTRIRRLTPTECERLQGFPDGWTDILSDSQRYKCLGNAVTVNVVDEVVRRLLVPKV